MDFVNDLIGTLNGYLFSNYVVFTLLGTGILFTLWSFFGQYRALTHGVQVVRGVYDSKDDPGAINHFQALSAALSATVGLGNIAGVSLAVALGGPGAIFWMWVIGVVGMALKMTEVTQSMLYRNTDDPDNPHGGPMFVAREGFKKMGLAPLGVVVGGIFVITLLISAITGGNMFQAWNVADITYTYFKVPQIATGIVLAVVVGVVIIGGIKRIGTVAGAIVPFMCLIYLLAAGYVLILNIGEIPSMLALIVRHGLFADADPQNAFVGGTVGAAALWGIKRALFSSEAGQGSAPIAHAAAKTDEPVREGVVAGIEPFIDTIVVCTLTALVILSTGTWNRGPEAYVDATVPPPALVPANQIDYTVDGDEKTLTGQVVASDDTSVTILVEDDPALVRIPKADIDLDRTRDIGNDRTDDGVTADRPWAELPGMWVPEFDDSTYLTTMPTRTAEARKTAGRPWESGDSIFMLVRKGLDEEGDPIIDRIFGTVHDDGNEVMIPAWRPFEFNERDGSGNLKRPSAHRPAGDDEAGIGIYGDYAGASLTAHAFDRVQPGLGMYLVTIAAWLFALSTMISWSYYGEQGIYYLGGKGTAIFIYKIVYCSLIAITCLGFIQTDAQLDAWTTMGLGVMLVANIPIMLIFGAQAMSAYHEYLGKLKRGEFPRHDAPKVTDVVEGRDVE